MNDTRLLYGLCALAALCMLVSLGTFLYYARALRRMEELLQRFRRQGRSELQDTGQGRSELQDTGQSRSELQDMGQGRSELQDMGQGRSELQDTGQSRSEL